MGRKVFISVLGFTNYGECIYVKDEYKSSSVRFIQEATLDYLRKQGEWSNTDTAYILLTAGAEKNNWCDNGHKDKNTGEFIKCEGLCSRLKKMDLPFNVNTIVNLPDGNTADEIWDIFERVFSVLQDDDELYFDLTHGFRYLPMLVMALINYSKFLKGALVKSITYGNYESRNKATNEALIIDLLPLSILQDWTYAAGQFLDSGNIDKLKYLCDKELKPILANTQGTNAEAKNLREFVKYLNDVVSERQTCRGMSIIKSENFKKLKNISDKLDTIIISPLAPVFNKIKESMNFFDKEENIINGFYSAVWCYKNGLLQQSATILQEFVISYICLRHDLRVDDVNQRSLVTSAFTIKFNNIAKSGWKLSTVEQERSMQAGCIEKILNDTLFSDSEFINAFNNLSKVRNDYNHAGMRSRPMPLTPQRIKCNIEKCINIFESKLINAKNEVSFTNPKKKDRLFINLSNHPYSQWNKKQREAACIYGDIMDIPFPDIDEIADEHYISVLADEYLQKILNLAKDKNVTVHLMGELTFTFALVGRLQENGIPCIASTSKRVVMNETSGRKGEVIFEFERFRQYTQ